jgi:hypothetical protein
LFSAGGVVSNERGTTWKREVQKESTQSELYFVLCFISIPCMGVNIQIWRQYFRNAPCNFNMSSKYLVGLMCVLRAKKLDYAIEYCGP